MNYSRVSSLWRKRWCKEWNCRHTENAHLPLASRVLFGKMALGQKRENGMLGIFLFHTRSRTGRQDFSCEMQDWQRAFGIQFHHNKSVGLVRFHHVRIADLRFSHFMSVRVSNEFGQRKSMAPIFPIRKRPLVFKGYGPVGFRVNSATDSSEHCQLMWLTVKTLTTTANMFPSKCSLIHCQSCTMIFLYYDVPELGCCFFFRWRNFITSSTVLATLGLLSLNVSVSVTRLLPHWIIGWWAIQSSAYLKVRYVGF